MMRSGWYKSSRSNAGGDNCVEVRMDLGSDVGVRDSKNRANGALWLPPAAWSQFVKGLALQ